LALKLTVVGLKTKHALSHKMANILFSLCKNCYLCIYECFRIKIQHMPLCLCTSGMSRLLSLQ